jgi:hypothetical protein
MTDAGVVSCTGEGIPSAAAEIQVSTNSNQKACRLFDAAAVWMILRARVIGRQNRRRLRLRTKRNERRPTSAPIWPISWRRCTPRSLPALGLRELPRERVPSFQTHGAGSITGSSTGECAFGGNALKDLRYPRTSTEMRQLISPPTLGRRISGSWASVSVSPGGTGAPLLGPCKTLAFGSRRFGAQFGAGEPVSGVRLSGGSVSYEWLFEVRVTHFSSTVPSSRPGASRRGTFQRDWDS